MRRAWILVVVVSALAGITGAVALLHLRDSDDTTSVDGTLAAAGSEPIAARPRPADPPEPVAGVGACGEAMDALRGLIVVVPSGALLDEAQNAQLTAGLDQLDQSCGSAAAEVFRDRELVPWLTYAPS